MTSHLSLRQIRPSPVFVGILAVTIVAGVFAWTIEGNLTATRISVFVLVLAAWVVSLCLHEFAHAVTAWRLGDLDVAARGYLTLNPLRYSHPLLSLVLPLAFIALGGIGLPGGAVYLNTAHLSPGQRRRISLAGPAVNLTLAVVLLAVIAAFGRDGTHQGFWFGLSFLAFLQVMATVLNLLPIPGLDGYALLESRLSGDTRRALDQFAPFGLLAVFALLTIPQLNRVFFDAIYWLFELSGVPRGYSMTGFALFRFWS
ncbi:site-2 protease family protein [Tomitella biformata]|uniref:site-2 protease family protein n=1 Tax=Tomitella biformata TaxID=630403 RepID=UPI000464BC1B|nr:site-2 protease family protein [Tomitella biformata]